MFRTIYEAHCVNDNPCPELPSCPRTDIDTIHSYVDVYDAILPPIKNSVKSVLMLGSAGPDVTSAMGRLFYNCGDVKLIRQNFSNAQITAVDPTPAANIWGELRSDDKISLTAETNAYSRAFFDASMAGKTYDLIVEDGTHAIGDLSFVVSNYVPLLTGSGVLLIESIQNLDDVDTLTALLPEVLKSKVKVYDLRDIKGRYDDILLVLNKSA
jgi:hypothetical protein